MVRRSWGVVATALLLVLLGAASAPAQVAPKLSPVGGAPFPDRAFVLTLPSATSVDSGDVRLRENGEVVEDVSITPGAELGQKQFGTVLVIDSSISMRGEAIAAAMRAARSFARRRNPLQPLAVITFNAKTDVRLPLTIDGGDIRTALAGTPSLARETHVYDATAAGIDLLERERVRAGTVIVLSDGSDTGSQATLAQVARRASRAPARIYTVGLRTRAYRSSALRQLAKETDGVFAEADSDRLEGLYASLSRTLDNQYVLRYRSTAALGERVKVSARLSGRRGVASATYSTRGIPVAGAAAESDDSFLASTLGAITLSLLCALLLGAAVLALLAPRNSVRSRVEQYVGGTAGPADQAGTAAFAARLFGNARGRRGGRSRWTSFVDALELAGIRTRPETLLLWTLLVTILVGWLFAVAAGSAGAAVLGLMVPAVLLAVIRVGAARQRRLFADQLPDNLQVVASAMRAGHTFTGALAVVLEDTPEPSQREFRRVLTDEQIGVDLQEAMRRVAQRMQSEDFERLALITTLQRETGGNSAEVMDRLTETIRERAELRRIVGALTAQGRLTRWIVSLLPPILFGLIVLVSPEYVEPLYTTTGGLVALGIGAALVAAGSVIIGRIVDFEV